MLFVPLAWLAAILNPTVLTVCSLLFPLSDTSFRSCITCYLNMRANWLLLKISSWGHILNSWNIILKKKCTDWRWRILSADMWKVLDHDSTCQPLFKGVGQNFASFLFISGDRFKFHPNYPTFTMHFQSFSAVVEFYFRVLLYFFRVLVLLPTPTS